MNYSSNSKYSIKKDKLIEYLIYAYLILKPFYFWSSGLPQLSDLILIILLIVSIIFKVNKLIIEDKKFMTLILIFCMYVCIINSIWSIFLGGTLSIMKFNLFYVQNMLVCLTIIFLYKKYSYRVLDYLFRGIRYSILIQLICLLIKYDTSIVRQTLFFNNPNQLAYYAICSLVILLLTIPEKQNNFLTVISIIVCNILSFVSLSKAGIITCIFITFSFILFKYRKINTKKIAKYLITILVLFIMLVVINPSIIKDSKILDSTIQRLSNIGKDSDDNLAGRGYDRLINNIEYIVLGAGEGKYERFDSVLNAEVHSTLGNMLFSYGLVGTSIFILIVLKFINKRDTFNLISIFAILILYGATHNGIRNTFLWIIICINYINYEKYLFKLRNREM